MTDWIDRLDDTTVTLTVARWAAAQPQTENFSKTESRGLDEALAATFGTWPAEQPRPGEGELARDALRVLAADPHQATAIRALATGPTPEKMIDPLTAVGVVTAALVVLQTKVKFELDAGGRWTLEIEKSALKDSTIADLGKKLLGFLGGGR